MRAALGKIDCPDFGNGKNLGSTGDFLGCGCSLFSAFKFEWVGAHTEVCTVRDQYKLNRPDVGWYQVRNALKARNASGDTAPGNFGPFERAYQTLTEKLQPQVFSLGFLR